MKSNRSTFLVFLVILLLIINIISIAFSFYMYSRYKQEKDNSQNLKTANSDVLSDNEDLEDIVSDMKSVIYGAEVSLDKDLDGDDKIGNSEIGEEEDDEENCYHISTDGEFFVTSPCENEVLDSVFNIAGRGRVFEALYKVRIKDGDGNELYDGSYMTEGGYKDNLDAFSDTVTWSPPAERGSGTIEFYINSAVDGSEVVMVSFPIKY